MPKYFTTVNVFNVIMYYFGWDRVNFLHRSLYHATFWICVEKNCWYHMDILTIAEPCLHSIKAFLVSQPAPTVSRLGTHKKMGGNAVGIIDPIDQGDIPHPMFSCSAMKAEGKKEEGGKFVAMAFVFPSNHYTWWILKIDKHLPANGKYSMNPLLCFACTHSLLIN